MRPEDNPHRPHVSVPVDALEQTLVLATAWAPNDAQAPVQELDAYLQAHKERQARLDAVWAAFRASCKVFAEAVRMAADPSKAPPKDDAP